MSAEKIIALKNKLMAEYMTDLKSKDDDYVKEFKRQSEEIGKLYPVQLNISRATKRRLMIRCFD